MARKKKSTYDLDIPEYQIDSPARVLLPILQEYLSSDEGKKDYAKWIANNQKKNHKNTTNELNDI